MNTWLLGVFKCIAISASDWNTLYFKVVTLLQYNYTNKYWVTLSNKCSNFVLKWSKSLSTFSVAYVHSPTVWEKLASSWLRSQQPSILCSTSRQLRNTQQSSAPLTTDTCSSDTHQPTHLNHTWIKLWANTHQYLQQSQLLHAVVQEFERPGRHLPGSLQEDEQRTLAGEQVTAQIQQTGLSSLDQITLLHVDGSAQQQPVPAPHRLTERTQPVGTIWTRRKHRGIEWILGILDDLGTIYLNPTMTKLKWAPFTLLICLLS